MSIITNNKWSLNYNNCISCGTTNHKHKAKGLCTRCYQKKHNYPQEYCSKCNKLTRVHSRLHGVPLCRSCSQAPIHICNICKKAATAALKFNNQYVCDSCYRKHFRKKYTCSICGKDEFAAIRSEEYTVCIKCYTTKNNFCNKCGRTILSPYLIDNKSVCNRCYEKSKSSNSDGIIDITRKTYICNICGQVNSVQEVYNDGSIICPDCYSSISKLCGLCKNPDNVIYSHLKSLPYCRKCYYQLLYIHELNESANKWNKDFYDIIAKFLEEKLKIISYESSYNLIKENEHIFHYLNEEFIKKNNSFTIDQFYELIKMYPSKKIFINDIISFLCIKNLLINFQHSYRILDSITSETSHLPKQLQKTLLSYNEFLVSKAKKYEEKGWIGQFTRFNYYTCYLYILTSIRFFTFLSCSLSISETASLNNHIVDMYIRLKPYDRGNLRHLVKFMNAEKLTFIKIALPNANFNHQLPVGLREDIQLKIYDKIINDPCVTLRDKVLLSLMILFAFTPGELQNLKKDYFAIRTENKVTILTLNFNKAKYKIPDNLYQIYINYIYSLKNNTEFIFPGRIYQKPLSLSSICHVLKKHGVTSTQLNCTAISNAMLNGMYQPALLMRSFRISNNTASRYYKLVKGSLEFE
ncbi:hypothetical protein Cpap_0060 [Ruminiclostridium papyrosolvens DSM 2782]|uniref:Uncharacterized protein n=1 Tax=Ruminiclostridium papyrosolvens DSM 2782 TaxID=588581 RepID=F1TIN4_9FIRM|nr:hypothetical protein [Ruminiclostridium papyrosolvens]EGD45733.1 hypothetical protein Cpap_0060 [Ruminiclostridium papyrosolvens DSM 2782]WES35319.1 hypothetical protein P0092_04905 [Ruminiclostridium papyrosolvens DSM 2782]